MKRRPVSNNYVTVLEDRIAWFESFVSILKLASPAERDTMLKIVTFQDHLRQDTGAIGRKGVESYLPTLENRLLSVSLQRNGHGIYSVFIHIRIELTLLFRIAALPWSYECISRKSLR